MRNTGWSVIPAKAGIHRIKSCRDSGTASYAAQTRGRWIPAGVYPRAGLRPDTGAGMTGGEI